MKDLGYLCSSVYLGQAEKQHENIMSGHLRPPSKALVTLSVNSPQSTVLASLPNCWKYRSWKHLLDLPQAQVGTLRVNPTLVEGTLGTCPELWHCS